MLHGLIIGSMSTAIMPFSGYMLTRPRRDVTLGRAFMADLQMLAKYPVYGIIINVIPYTYPAIVAFLVVAALRSVFLSVDVHQRYVMNLQRGLRSSIGKGPCCTKFISLVSAHQ
jgi:branched-subunit amino acid transport protein AzlD